MANDEYQAMFGLPEDTVRDALSLGDAAIQEALAPVPDSELKSLVGDLGGHDIEALLDAFRAADAETDRPTVVMAYTVKGWGLPFAGDPLNHSAQLTGQQIDALRSAIGLTAATEWDRFVPGSPEDAVCGAAAGRLERRPPTVPTVEDVPVSVLGALGPDRRLSTQEAFGQVLSRLARTDLGRRIVTLAPDVSVSTNLGGWINKVGVFAPSDLPNRTAPSSPLRWEQSPRGQHIELGISEMNLFSLLGQLGLAWDHSGEPLLPVGTVYDPFVCRGLDAFIYAAYNGARFIVAGTPSGVTLAPEGGAHQSTITPSIGVELPGVTFAEPAYAGALDWLLCDSLRRVRDLSLPAEAFYLRLSTRPIDQAPFVAATDRLGADRLRREVLTGGYRLVDAPLDGRPRVTLASSGATMSEVVAAAEELAVEGVAATVVDITSLDRLYRGWADGRRRRITPAAGSDPAAPHVWTLLDPGAPIVTVHDGASHAMAWLGSVHGVRVVPLGVDDFGQSGTIADLYEAFHLRPGAIVNAALLAVGC